MGSEDGDRDERPVHEGLHRFTISTWGVPNDGPPVSGILWRRPGTRPSAEKAGWAYTCRCPGCYSHETRPRLAPGAGFETTDEHPALVIRPNDAMAFCGVAERADGSAVACRRRPRGVRRPAPAARKIVSDAAWYEENASRARPVAAGEPTTGACATCRANAFEWCLGRLSAGLRRRLRGQRARGRTIRRCRSLRGATSCEAGPGPARLGSFPPPTGRGASRNFAQAPTRDFDRGVFRRSRRCEAGRGCPRGEARGGREVHLATSRKGEPS